VIVPVRPAPELAAAVKVTAPLPVPLAPVLMVIHGVAVVAVHAQAAVVVTFTGEPAPPAIPIDWLAGLIAYEQPLVCVSVNVWPAIVMVPVRVTPELAAAVKLTSPLPVPVAPEAMVIHEVAVVAVHAQPAAVETLTADPAPPAAPIDWLAGLIVYEQPLAWLTVNVWPATVIVPVRAGPESAATVKVRVPFPLPTLPVVMVIQPSAVEPVHAQPVAVVTAIGTPAPPAAAIDWLDGLMEVAHDPA
jgi:hypothetical protein